MTALFTLAWIIAFGAAGFVVLGWITFFVTALIDLCFKLDLEIGVLFFTQVGAVIGAFIGAWLALYIGVPVIDFKGFS